MSERMIGNGLVAMTANVQGFVSVWVFKKPMLKPQMKPIKKQKLKLRTVSPHSTKPTVICRCG